MGFRVRAAAQKPKITMRNSKHRLQWCKACRHWTLEQWKRVLGILQQLLLQGSNRAWYMKKNEDVKEVKITTVLKQKAYMLFYVRCDKSPIKKSHKAIQSCSPNHHQYLCCLDKGHRGFGFTLCTNKDKLEHYVKKVKGRAEKAGLWNGAYIIKINGINVEGKRPEDVAHMISTLETINLLVVTEETYHCHKICKIPLTTLHWKESVLQPAPKAADKKEKQDNSANIMKSAAIHSLDSEESNFTAEHFALSEERDEPSTKKGENDILIHCDGIDGEKQKLLFEGILHHRVELFTLKRNTMLLTCQTAEEVNTILATGKYKIDGKELHIEARNGSSFDIDAYHMKLEGLDENTPLKLVTSFIEESSGRSHLDFNVDYAKNGKAAIITFLQPIAWKGFQKACSSRKLHNRDILATPMQMTKWLFVEGLPSNITMAALHQYFQREAEICGGDINNILMTKDNQMAYLQFDSSEGAKQVLAKKHCLEQTSLQMYRYNIEENIVVRGCRTVDVEFPKKVTCHIDHNILKLMLKNSVFTEYIERKFGSISAQLLFYPPTSIDVIPTFNIGTIPSLNLSQHWRSAVHKILEETMSRFGEKTFAVSHPEVWSRAWEEIAPLMDNSRIISFDLSSLNIHLHGEVKDLRITGEKLQKAVEKAHQDIQLDPNYIERIPHLEFSTPNFNTKKKISRSRKTKGFI
uniref:uncharacterized protein n=2 Tax=Myxine glutinosa TaxID=7769 RepID=UPI00358F2ACA